MHTDRFYNLSGLCSGRSQIGGYQIGCLVVGLLVSLWTNVASAHEFEDGHVERAVSVVIRGDVARLEYSIGLNPVTRQQLIDFWESQEKAADVAADVSNATKPADDDRFLALAGSNVSRRLSFCVDGTEIEAKLISSALSARHHVDVTVTLEFKLPAAQSEQLQKLKIVDRNFRPSVTPDVTQPTAQDDSSPKSAKLASKTTATVPAPAPMGGGFRYALKAKGNRMLARSNVASILIRAQRTLDSDRSQSESEHEQPFTIIADLATIE